MGRFVVGLACWKALILAWINLSIANYLEIFGGVRETV